ncbi:MAG TPA: ABC transporter ATP-binding protein [Actinomycetes bacterium]
MAVDRAGGQAVLRPYVGALARHGGRRLALALALLVLVTVLEGAGLLLLVPLLELAGVLGGAAPPRVAAPFAAAGLRPTLPLVLAVFVATVTGQALLTTRRDLLLTELQLGFTDAVRKRLFAGIAAAQWPWLSRRRRSDLLDALTSDAARIAGGTRLFLEGLVATGMALAHLAVAILLSPPIALAATAAAAVLLALSAPAVRRARRHGERLTRGGRGLLAAAAEFLDGVKLAKSHDREDAHVAAFAAALDTERDARLDYERSRGANAAARQATGVVMLAGVVWASVTVAHLPPARLVALVFVFSRLLPLTADLVGRAQQLAQLLPAYAAVAATTRAAEAAAEAAAPGEGHDDLRLRTRIRLDGATVRYRPDGPPALDHATLVIPARSTTAVVGPSGAGKTTLVDVLLGLLPLSTGTVEVDGRALAGPTRPWRRRVAYVPQETFLFDGTVASNLRWARPGASDDELWEALRLAAADGFVRLLPDGLATPVGDRGARLSGGERQRLAIARALLRRPDVLLLDEATSSLDGDNEEAVVATLDRLRGTLTIVAVTHSRAAIRHADRVVTLDGGRVVEAHAGEGGP